MSTYSIALIGGDGIGPEILREGKKVMDAAAEATGITWQWKEYPYGAEHWLQYRKGEPTLFTEEEMAVLGTHDAVYFGSVGDPRVPESVGQAGERIHTPRGRVRSRGEVRAPGRPGLDPETGENGSSGVVMAGIGAADPNAASAEVRGFGRGLDPCAPPALMLQYRPFGFPI